MVALNKETYLHSVRFLLMHMFPEKPINVETYLKLHTFQEVIVFKVTTPSGIIQDVHYVIDVEEFSAVKPPRIPEEVIATIMLLVG